MLKFLKIAPFVILTVIFTHIIVYKTVYYTSFFGYTILIMIICISGLSIWRLVKNNEYGMGLLLLLMHTSIIKGILHLPLFWSRDTPALMATTEKIRLYGFPPPINLISSYQLYYSKHPGLHMLSIFIIEILDLTDPENLILIFFYIFTIFIPLFFHIVISKYFSSKVGLISAFFITLTSTLLVYDPYSRGTLALPLMLTLFFLVGRTFSGEKLKGSDIILENILLLTLILTHDFSSAIFAFFVFCIAIASYIFGDFKWTKMLNLFFLALIVFLIYEIYYSQTVINYNLRKILSLEESQLSFAVILRTRTLKEQVSLITRSLFWLSAWILCLMHIKNKLSTKRKNVFGFFIFGFFLILISIVTGLLPPRVWLYAYFTLVPAAFSVITLNVIGHNKLAVTITMILFIVSYLISQIAALSSLFIAPYSIDRYEYLRGEYRYKLFKSEIEAIDWIFHYSGTTPHINLIGDLCSYLIASKHPLQVDASLDQLRSAFEDYPQQKNTLLIYRREMEYIVRGFNGYFFLHVDAYKNVVQRYNIIYVNSEVIVFYI